LQAVNDCLGGLRDPLELLLRSRFVFGGVVENGEFIRMIGSPPIQQDKLPNQIVQCTPQIIQTISDNEVDLIGNGWGGTNQAPDLLSSIRIGLVGDTIQLGVIESGQFDIKSIDVLYRSLYFKPTTFNCSYHRGENIPPIILGRQGTVLVKTTTRLIREGDSHSLSNN